MRPQPPHPSQVVFELRELHLELALRGVRMGSEDVEDDRGAIDHRQAERALEVALLARCELVVARDQVRVGAGQLPLQFVDLAGTQIAVGVGMVAVLDELPDPGHPGCAQQLAELGQLVVRAVGKRRDQIRALASASARPLPVLGRGGRTCAPVAALLHGPHGSRGR